jgi:hypothetical protein
MLERVPAPASPAAEPPARPPAATGPVAFRPVSVQRIAAELAHRHAGADERVRTGAAALQRAVATRRMIAREDEPPGPPDMPDVYGLVCGRKDGKWSCTLQTPKGEVEVDPDTFSPQDRQAAIDPKRPKNCPPERWNWFWANCCAPGKHFNLDKRACVPNAQEQPMGPPAPPPEPPMERPPPAPPPEKGDFPLPAGDPVYA